MKEILRYLLANSISMESFLRVMQNELFLRFWNIDILILFDYIDDSQFKDSFVNVEDLSYEKLCNIPVKKINIQKGSYINDDDVRGEYLDYYEPYTMIAHELIRNINGRFEYGVRDFRVTGYSIDDSCPMCGEVYNYGFQIDVSNRYWNNLDFFRYVVEVLDKDFHYPVIPSFYNTNKVLFDNFEIKFLYSNTKIRRLGYLKILLSMFNKRPQIPISKLPRDFELLCQEYEDYRKQYKNTKGNVIITKSGNSAMPYIELSQKMGLVLKSATAYRLGKNGIIYNSLANNHLLGNKNPFVLNNVDKYFFGEILMREDFLFIYTILEQISLRSRISYKLLKLDFKEILLRKISEYIDIANLKNKSAVGRLQLAKRQITQWNNSASYMEHIIMPRLNWLYDLDYIVLNKDLSFHLTDTGHQLLLNLTSWNDISLWSVCSPTNYLDMYYMRMLNDIYGLKKSVWDNTKLDIIKKYLEESISLFRTLAPNRITYSLFVLYLKYNSFMKDGLVIDEYDVRNLLESQRIPLYILKYQSQYKDGYIQKLK